MGGPTFRPYLLCMTYKFLYIGRIDKIKNIPFAIELVRTLVQEGHDCSLSIFGIATKMTRLEKKLRKQARKLPIIFFPWVNDPVSVYLQHDCILIPSFSEGLCMIAQEANSLRKIVIMNDVGLANHELPPAWNIFIRPLILAEWIKAAKIAMDYQQMAFRYCLEKKIPMIVDI